MQPKVFLIARGVVLALALLAAPDSARAQGGGAGAARSDSLASPGVRLPRAVAPQVRWQLPASLTPWGRALRRGQSSTAIAAEQGRALDQWLAERLRERWRQSMIRARDLGVLGAPPPVLAADLFGPEPADSGILSMIAEILGENSTLGATLNARFEAKVDRSRNERCTASQYWSLAAQCAGGFQPNFDMNFDIKSFGSLAGRLFVNVDYDSQREFEASNNINIYFQGKSDELLERFEVGNVSLQLPPSQFITSGIPAGNYGFQAIGQLGPMRYRGILAQQKGNIPKSYDVVVGDRTLRADSRELADYQIEARRFFFTVDPLLFGPQYPNVDILNGVQMRSIAEALPDTVRPRKLSVYRLLLGGQPKNPNGPRFRILGDPNSQAGQVYELLQENVDYYTDPSLLWIALQQPLNPTSERLVLAYTLRVGGRDTVIATVGGTPDVSFEPTRPQFANLLWDPQVRPGDAAFRREIRSAYRVGGEDLRRNSVTLRVLAGTGAGQEKPVSGAADTYLQMFGLSQFGNVSLFDFENRMWPRPADPNVSVGGAPNAKIIRDHYLVLPSLRPFGRDGLVLPGNPASDTIYVTPGEDLYSAQHPPSQYRLQFRYEIEGGSNVGTLMLGAVQLRKYSETVLVDGLPLVRDSAYTIDYEVGMITFTRPDTLFPRPRRVSVRYEENPLFAAAPTSILGFAGQFPLERGEFGLTLIRQAQSTSFTRPPLGYEPQSSLIAGVSGRFGFDAPLVSRLIERWPTITSTTLSRLDLQAEFATSRPQPNRAGVAYVESFEGEGGIAIPLQEAAWYYSSQPALGQYLPQRFGAETFSLGRASTMAWQSAGLSRAGVPLQFTLPQIDPQVTLAGGGITAPQPMLWLTLYPLSVGGLLSDRTGNFQWLVEGAPLGRRWRSVRAGLGPSGADLSRTEFIEFWTLADTATARRASNASIVIDLGDISENSVAFSPAELTLVPGTGGVTDSLYRGKILVGIDRMDTERDSLSRSFNQATDDKGLPGDVIPTLAIWRGENFELAENVPTCSRSVFQLLLLGDARANCTVRNGRLDEEDLDFDNALNLLEAQRDQERLRRYVVDLSNPASYNRVGNCNVAPFDSAAGGSGSSANLCWVRVQVPFAAPDDSLNGGPNIRRVRAIRMTVVSGVGAADSAFSFVPLALFKFQGSPLIKRSNRTVRGIGGDETSQGFVIASVIGTQDRDTLRNVDYESPPGVSDAADRQVTGLENVQTQINERALRLLAGGMEPYERAEAFIRFAEGSRNFMNYRQLRVWARGRGNGWGEDGELQFYIKLGRDAHNFYLYRTPVNSGRGREAWLPEVVVDFGRLFELQAQLQNDVFQATPDSIACTGVDSVLVARSALPTGQPANRRAVCSGGYIVYSVDPGVSPPSLAQVQEMAVGMIRVAQGGGMSPITLADTLELWVNDVRLTGVNDTPGYAGAVSLSLQAGDVANVRMNVSRRDANFRQLGEQPTYLANSGLDIATSVRLERLIPRAGGYAMPLTVSHTRSANDPLFLSQSDIPAAGIDRLRTPRNEATRYGLSVYRTTPVAHPVVGAIVNNLSANVNVASASSRSEFSEGESSNWNVAMDYNNVLTTGRYVTLPRWLTFGGGEPARLRLTPSQVRFSTDIGRSSDDRLSFSRPAALVSDTGRRVRGMHHQLRTQSAVEFRPLNALSASWGMTSVRDLRDYGDTTASAVVAAQERGEFLGMDVGLERERQMNTSVSLIPTVVPYFRPSVTFISTYSMLRDPQARQLVRTGDSTGAFRLPRRMQNFQTVSATSLFDPSRALRTWLGTGPRVTRVADYFQQLDLQYSRTLSSSYDGAAFDPGLGYQFSLGGVDAFRRVGATTATIAGVTDQLSLTSGLRLTRDLHLTGRAQLVSNENFSRRLDNVQARIEGSQVTWPDVTLRWSDSLPWLKNWRPFGDSSAAPFRFLRVISTLGLNVGVNQVRQFTFAPSGTEGEAGDRRVYITRRSPVRGTVAFNDNGGLFTTFYYESSQRTDSVPGSITRSRTTDLAADISRSFPLPARWNLRSRLRARLGWQRSETQSFITVQNAEKPSRLADNGRTAVNLNADTDLSANLKFSLLGARVVTFDNNYDRRFSQYVVTAVFSLFWFAGDMR